MTRRTAGQHALAYVAAAGGFGLPASELSSGDTVRKILTVDAPRILLGLLFLVGAIEGFTFMLTGNHLIHPPTSPAGEAFELALQQTGFVWPLVKTVHLIGALCLLTNRAPAFGIAILLPAITVIALFHFVLNPAGIPMAVIMVVLTAMLLFAYRDRYLPLFRSAGMRVA